MKPERHLCPTYKIASVFGEINVNNLIQGSIQGATVIIDNGTITDTMIQIPGFGIYTSPAMIGETGKTYKLTVLAEGKHLLRKQIFHNQFHWIVSGGRLMDKEIHWDFFGHT